MKSTRSGIRHKRLRFYVPLAVALVLRRWDDSAALFTKFNRLHPLSRKALDEVLIHIGLVLGYPIMLEAFSQSQQIVTSRSRKSKSRLHRSGGQTGRSLLGRIYGDQTVRLLRNLAVLHPELPKWILRDVYGKVFTRPGLTLQDREILNVVLMTALGLKTQLYSHVRGALRVKVHPEDIKYALSLMKRDHGVPVAYAFRVLKELCRKPELC